MRRALTNQIFRDMLDVHQPIHLQKYYFNLNYENTFNDIQQEKLFRTKEKISYLFLFTCFNLNARINVFVFFNNKI